uniref:HINT domain-containing protein n=1 Tax=Streptomyces sp. NBC_00049 TaxID=2903617 RepID=A0AAU2JYI7_9ACTN
MEAFTKAKKAEDEAAAAAAKAAKSGDAKGSKESASDSAGTDAKASKGEADAEVQGSGADTPSAATQCNSFPTGVQVLTADGTTKAIEDVGDGDTVTATDPQAGETGAKSVTATITTPDDKDFTDLTLTDDANPRGPPSVITSTYHHPYWSETRQQWVDAGELIQGEHLRQPNGTTFTVTSVRNYPHAVPTHNLTVNDVHTHYVLAGATPVLVHNCDVDPQSAPGGKNGAAVSIKQVKMALGRANMSVSQYDIVHVGALTRANRSPAR